jgi:hypothetical protein
MARTITLTEIRLVGMFVNIGAKQMIVTYTIHDAEGVQWGPSLIETYWVDLPDPPGSADVQLPAVYLEQLTGMYNAAKAALEAKYL